MNEFLVFRLYGPLASWGEIAVGEVRRSSPYPGRSSILGIVCAALGILRDETEKLNAVFAGYDIAVKVQSVGTLLKDYHTVQVPDDKGKFIYVTRRDEMVLGKDRLGTILTSREYRCDALSVVTMRPRTGAPYSLETLREKLQHPEFVLYLGRKSCPLSLPMKPQIISAKGFRAALDGAVFPPLAASYDDKDSTSRYIPVSASRYYWEGDAGDMQPQQTTERYDEPLSRIRWQFISRQEHLFVEPIGGE